MIQCQEKQSSQGEGFLSKVDQIQNTIVDDSELLTFFDRERKPLAQEMSLLPSGSVKPLGWIKQIMQHDLEHGIVGALDELYPGIKADDLYDTHRRGSLEDVPEMGDLVLTGESWEKSIMWWNAETIGNWWDGFVRHAYLTNDAEAIKQSAQIVQRLLKSQDEDGYIGIYKPSLRYQHTGSNGELWAQTTAFRMLLGYYEITGEEEVLEAVEKGMALTMAEYSDQGRNPFFLENAFGGVTHGLMLTDVCETLYRITGNKTYKDYAVYLYRAFSTYSINRAFNDLRYPYLAERDSLFTGHGVHTYEHFRTLINAAYQTGYPEMQEAYENALYKLDQCLLPSGAGHGNEWIAGMKADADYTHSEYCTMLELRNFYTSALQKTGDASFGDHAEKLTFNGMMGFRNPDGTALTYGKGDNCYQLDGQHHGQHENHADSRYKYSPTHSDPAVCCVPNYTRNYPYYLDYMWMRKTDGLAATLYGPSVLTTEWEGKEVVIRQETSYPFSDQIALTIECESPVEFTLYLRKPSWAKSLKLDSDDVTLEKNGFVEVNRTWQGTAKILINFEVEIDERSFGADSYVQRGALVYALPIPHKEKVIKEYGHNQFRDYYCLPTDESLKSYAISKSNSFSFEQDNLEDGESPWYNDKTRIQAQFVEPSSGNKVKASMIPMGSTVLRKVTFQAAK